MKRAAACLSLAVLVPSVAAADPAQRVHDGPSAPALAWAAAMEAGDMTALARMHDEGTTAFPPAQPELHGRKTIMGDYRSLFARYSVHVAMTDTHWIESGPLVVSWGRTALTLHPKAGGVDVVSHTRFTDAAVRSGKGWRYVVDHASVEPGNGGRP